MLSGCARFHASGACRLLQARAPALSQLRPCYVCSFGSSTMQQIPEPHDGLQPQHRRRRQRGRGNGGQNQQPAATRTGELQQTRQYGSRTSTTTLSHLVDVRFDSLPLCSETKRALREVLRYDLCTQVQAQSLPAILQGSDAVVKAKTGTGKTLAFLIPAIEQWRAKGKQPGSISILVLSPTRELAAQIAAEAQQLATFHRMTIQTVVGGTNISTDQKRLRNSPPDILVATPGRLEDLMRSGHLPQQQLLGLQTLTFDEADRLLDMGFRNSIDKILKHLPSKQSRQTTLFSATFPQNIKSLADYALRPGWQVVDTVGEDAMHASEQVQQRAMVVPMADMCAALWSTIQQHVTEDPQYKVIVFFTTARLTQYYAEIFRAMGRPVLEMHSRKSQSARTKCADQFRSSSQLIMFSSDVSARGVDYADVSQVVQVGMASDAEQYVHRVGRTARAGKQGLAVLLLHDFEERFLSTIKDLPVQRVQPPGVQPAVAAKLAAASQRLSDSLQGMAYQAWLGYYNSHLRRLGWSQERLVQMANEFSTTMGRPQPPALLKKTIGMMGLKGVPGLRIETPDAREGRRQGGSPGAGGQQRQQQPGRPAQGQGRGAGGFRGGGGGAPGASNGFPAAQPGQYASAGGCQGAACGADAQGPRGGQKRERY